MLTNIPFDADADADVFDTDVSFDLLEVLGLSC